MSASIPTITHIVEVMHALSLESALQLPFASEQSAQSAHEKIVSAMHNGEVCVVETCAGTVALDPKHWCAALVHDALAMDMIWKRHKAFLKNASE